MSLVDQRGGCKVGWMTFSTEAEALAQAKVEAEARERKFAQGYDFGYQWPGSVQHVPDHPVHGEVWVVTTV